MPLPLRRHPSDSTFLVRGDDTLPVHARQWFQFPGRDDGAPETWCYSDRLSYAAGERLTLFAVSTVPQVDLAVYSEGLNPKHMLERRSLDVAWRETGEAASVEGCGWPAIAELDIGADWPSGAYRITLSPYATEDGRGQASHLFLVRPSRPPAPGRLLLITADSTWNAYNDWGGSNHYEGVIEPESTRFSSHLSTQRPLAKGLVSLPADAPRTLPEETPLPLAPVTYSHMEWAWRHGYSKKYASAGWASYERHFVHWAERQGYRLDVASQQDLHFRPQVLEGYPCVAMVGHDEYWSWQMRDAIDAYVERGGRVARFAGNFLWQIRLEQDGQRQVCHKYLARQEDPLCHSNQGHLTTNCWEASEVGRPGHATFGLDASQGMYAGWGDLAVRGAGGFTLYRAEHWAFNGTGLSYGDLLGARGRVFGYEVDGLAHRIEDGLPYPTPSASLPEDLQILALGLARLREGGPERSGAPLFVGDEDARFFAELRFGKSDEAALARVDRGSGMIVHFTKGKGEVFHAGTTEWVAGLLRGDQGVEQVTRNVLDRFLGA
ncbi:MAG: N,N-dimethylformamidase beta subunit family domain-containing protein [Pseudomonadota bacterium]